MKSVYRKNCSDYNPCDPGFFHCGEVAVISDNCGCYLQAAEKPLARFGYRFPLNSGRPHLLRVRYPDNRRRFMTIGDGTSYDISCAIVTGHRWEISNTMQQLEEVFWPRFGDFSICFMTWGKNEAAAVESFEIFELEESELSPLDIDVRNGRSFGVQYEDPCGTQASEGASNFSQWLDRLFLYLKHTGQNTLVYPMCWYHGPWFPNEKEAAQTFSITVAEDRKQYIVWDDSPPDWPAEILERCVREGVEFTGEFTLLRLDSLMKKMNIDREAIAAGALTVNNMLSNNMVQSGTMDWTVVYHCDNYPDMLQSDDPFNTASPRKLAFGEQSRVPGCPVGPIFNVLHPEVRTAILEFFRESCRRYKHFAPFRGITVTMWASTILWYGSLRSGYDDYTAGLFESETECKLPVSPGDPERFGKRADYLLHFCKEQWIEWRCRKIADFLKEIRDVMTAERDDLTLSLTMWNEPFVPAVCEVNTQGSQFGSRESCDQLYRNGGIDLALLAGEKNIEIMFQTDGGNRDRSLSNRTGAPEAFHMFRDFDYLDDSVWEKLRRLDNCGVYIFNAWHEAWGEHRWFPAAPDDDFTGHNQVYGKKDCAAFRINSHYEPDGFWWDSQLRITPAAPPGIHYMEHFAHALAAGDALKITAGGLFLDKTHREEFRQFARVFRRLPRHKFTTVGSYTDPVAVRQYKCFAYCVNREPYPVEVALEFRTAPRGRLLSDGAAFTGEKLRLGPYELCGLQLEANEITGFQLHIGEAVVRQLRQRMESVLKLTALPEWTATEIRSAFQARRYSRLRHLLSSYPVAKAAESEESPVLQEKPGSRPETVLECT